MANIYLDDQNIDDLGRMVTALLSELWIMRDRMALTEALLAEKGVVTARELENYQPNPALAAEIDALRDRVVANVLGAPLAARERSVDATLARAGFHRPVVETTAA